MAAAPHESPLRAARDAATRDLILDLAERVFAAQGYAGTRMQDIAQAAEMSLATLYQHFRGKAALHRAVLIRRDEQMLARVSGPLGAGGLALESVLELIARQVGFLLEHPDYLRMQLQDGQFWYHSDTRPSAEEQRLWERGLALMTQLFDWGVDAGLFLPGDAADQARMLLSLQQTRLANWVHAEMREPHGTAISRIQSDFVRFFCRPAVAADWLDEDGWLKTGR